MNSAGEVKRENTEVDLTYVLISRQVPKRSTFRRAAQLYSTKVEYRYLEPQKKIVCLYQQLKAGEKLQLRTAIKTALRRFSAENKQAGVKVAAILLKLARKDLLATVGKS